MEYKYEWQKQPWWQLSCRLGKIPKSEYPRIWYELHEWNWPEELGEIPDGVSLSRDDTSKVILDLMGNIEVSVGRKALLRYSHKRDFGSTDQMFEDWWDSQGHTKALLQEITKDWKDSSHDGGHKGDSGRHQPVRTALCAALSFLFGLLVSFLFLA